MVLQIWLKFHVSSLIFEGEDLFYVILRKTHFFEKLSYFLDQIFKISTFLHMKPPETCRT